MSVLKNNLNLSLLKSISISALLVALFSRPFRDLLNVWQNDADYSHGYFVIPLSIYMIWRKKSLWKKLPDAPSWFGFFLFFGCIVIYTVSLLVKFHTLNYLSIIVLLIGIVLSLFGWKKSWYFIGPIIFLIFMFPIPTSIYILITNPLKLLITDISASIIRLFDIPVLQEGNLLFFSNTSLEVAEACSGLRSIYSYLMLGIVFSIFCNKLLSKSLLVFSAIPLSLFVNIFRVSFTGILSHYYGEKAAQGFFHEFTGMAFFLVGLVLMFGMYYFVEARLYREPKS